MNRAEAANFLGIEPTEKITVGPLVNGRGRVEAVKDRTNKSLVEKIEKGKADLAAGRGKTLTFEELEELTHESA